MMKKLYIVFMSCMALVFYVYSEVTDKSSIYFTNRDILISPQSSSVGNSDISYNPFPSASSSPTSLGQFKGNYATSLSYTNYYENSLSTSLLSAVRPISKNIGTGVYLSYLYIPDIQITSDLEKDSIGNIIFDNSLIKYQTASDIMFGVSSSWSFFQKHEISFTAGAAINALRRRLIDWTGYGISLDFAVSAEVKKMFVLTLLAKDLLSYANWSEKYSQIIKPNVYLALGFRHRVDYFYGDITVTYKSPDILSNSGVGYSLMNKKDSEERLSVLSGSVRENPKKLLTAASYGIQYRIRKTVSIRVGLDEIKKLSFGGGVSLFENHLSFNVAYILPYELSSVYSMGVDIKW